MNISIKKKTIDLKAQLKKINSFSDKIKFLKNSFDGEDCFILLTGPSFNDYSKEELRNKLKDKLVLSVKQTYLGLEDICDFHFWNCSNLPNTPDNIPYQYSDSTIAIASSNYPVGFRWNPKHYLDFFIKIPIIEQFGKENCLVFKRDFEEHTLNNLWNRTIGPGIMLETVLYFAVHIGVKSINTLGWDLDAHNSHCYSDSVANKGCQIPWDMKANLEAVPYVKEWLQNRSIELNTISKTGPMKNILPLKEI